MLLSFATFFLLLFSIGSHAQQDANTIVITPDGANGTPSYGWDDGEGSCFAAPTGNIVVTWDCVPGEDPVLTFDFTDFRFVNKTTHLPLNDDEVFVYQWNGLPATLPTPEYLSTMKLTDAYQVPGVGQGTLDITLGFVLQDMSSASFNQCIGNLELPDIEFVCPCNDVAPEAIIGYVSHEMLEPGYQYEYEFNTVLTDASTGGTHEREWRVQYRIIDYSTQPYTSYSWYEYSNEPNITVLLFGWDNPHFQSIEQSAQNILLRVWNCSGEDSQYRSFPQPRPEGDERSNEDRDLFINENTQPLLYPNQLKSGEMANLNINYLENEKQLSIRLIDVNGRIVKKQTLNVGESTFSTDDLTPGTYFVQLMEKNMVLRHQKLLIY